ncbi:MAG: nucleotidyl transferase AbiEii/AbiGii toxin family protein [Clostridia bacterium]|nr:nucleotidyl transferase AbiEii/AbiGii toxin family protein [Clostridia bacterium]
MKLHEFPNEFKDLISIVAADKHLPESAIERDYYIVLLLQNLANSEYAEKCVFKGGTSLSKCYPGSIERFSEDIDLTFLGMDESDKVCDKTIKKIEKVMTIGAQTEKIDAERSNRSKSMFVWFGDKANRVKLEIGSSVRPDPYSKKTLKTYIQEFLEEHDGADDIEKFGLQSITLNVLNIERTFVDKLMSVKRHAICGTIEKKVRHIYDVARLFSLSEIQAFLADKDELKRLIDITKQTDSYYLEKRNISQEYNPTGAYDFNSWKHHLNDEVRSTYENLHKELLYTDEQQNFDDAMNAFSKISDILRNISE